MTGDSVIGKQLIKMSCIWKSLKLVLSRRPMTISPSKYLSEDHKTHSNQAFAGHRRPRLRPIPCPGRPPGQGKRGRSRLGAFCPAKPLSKHLFSFWMMEFLNIWNKSKILRWLLFLTMTTIRLKIMLSVWLLVTPILSKISKVHYFNFSRMLCRYFSDKWYKNRKIAKPMGCWWMEGRLGRRLDCRERELKTQKYRFSTKTKIRYW